MEIGSVVIWKIKCKFGRRILAFDQLEANFHKLPQGGRGDAGYFHVELVFLFCARVFYSVFPEEVFFRHKGFYDYKYVMFEKADREFYWK